MNGFQILILVVLILLFSAGMTALVRGWSGRREGMVWCTLCILAAVATIWPQVTVTVANALGIGRGADLVFYCAVVVMMVGFWMTYIRLRYLRRDVTRLVRHIAILEARSQLPEAGRDHAQGSDAAPRQS